MRANAEPPTTSASTEPDRNALMRAEGVMLGVRARVGVCVDVGSALGSAPKDSVADGEGVIVRLAGKRSLHDSAKLPPLRL